MHKNIKLSAAINLVDSDSDYIPEEEEEEVTYAGSSITSQLAANGKAAKKKLRGRRR